MNPDKIRVLPGHPELLKNGFVAEYFPGYINRKKKLHSVDVVLLSFVLRGKGIHYLGEQAFPESGPSLSVIHHGQIHDIVSDSRGMDIINIYLNLDRFALPDIPVKLRDVLPQVLPLHPNFYHTPGHMTRIEFDKKSNAQTLMLLIYEEFRKKEEGYLELIRDYFKGFLVECCRSVLNKGLIIRGREQAKSHAIMEPVRQYLDLHYTRYLSLAALARHSGYSAPYLCRCFKEYTGKTLFDYLLDKRLQSVILQLRSTDRRIGDIAMDCGFTEPSFFNKFFKRKLGLTPREYRRRK